MLRIENSIARIFSNQTQEPVGVGFLVDDKLVITAAHVVSAATRYNNDDPSVDTLLSVDFPLVQADIVHSSIQAKVVVWIPSTSEAGTDIAVLELLSDEPETAEIARLLTLPDINGIGFDAYGIPTYPGAGVWATGITRRIVERGRVQIDGIKNFGYFIEPGFSGACVYSKEHGGVIGMIVAADSDTTVRSGQMIPSRYLIDAIQRVRPEYNSIGHTAPPKKSELLVSNLLRVSYFPEFLYVAPARHTSFKQAKQASSKACLEHDEWLHKSGNIYSFHALEESVWGSICDRGGVETHATADWAYSDDDSIQRDFVALLNKALHARIGKDLIYEFNKKYYYFAASPSLEKQIFEYQSLQNNTKREVFGSRGKKANGQPLYYRHSAFKGYFVRYDDQWYLEITPTYHFTWDGYSRDRFYEDRLSKIKQIEKNPAVRGQVIMWARYLVQGGDLFTPDYPFLKFGNLVTFEASVGINDDIWLATDSEDDEQLFDTDIDDDIFEEFDR